MVLLVEAGRVDDVLIAYGVRQVEDGDILITATINGQPGGKWRLSSTFMVQS